MSLPLECNQVPVRNVNKTVDGWGCYYYAGIESHHILGEAFLNLPEAEKKHQFDRIMKDLCLPTPPKY